MLHVLQSQVKNKFFVVSWIGESLAKIPGFQRELLKIMTQVLHMPGDDMNDGVLSLHHAFYFEQSALHNGSAVSFKNASPDHHINVVSFIFHFEHIFRVYFISTSLFKL